MGTWPGTQCLKDRWASSNNTLKHLFNDSCYLNTESKKEYFNNLSSARLMRVHLQRPVSEKRWGAGIWLQSSLWNQLFSPSCAALKSYNMCHLLSKVLRSASAWRSVPRPLRSSSFQMLHKVGALLSCGSIVQCQINRKLLQAIHLLNVLKLKKTLLMYS